MSSYPSHFHLNLRMANSTTLTSDNDFGPFLNLPGQHDFDFTLLFEETILSILPSALFLILLPPRLLRLSKTPRKVIGSYLQTTKIALLTAFAILQIVNVVEVTRSSFRTQASLAASLLVLVASIALCFLSYSEHTRNIRPSSLINAYLLLTLPFDASQLRTRWLRGENLAGNAVASATLVIKITIIISEAAEKRRLLLTPFADPSPEATSGLYSRGLFWWLNSLFRIGFSKLVSDNDLFKTDTKLLSKSLEASFNKHWVERENYAKKHTLVWVMARTMLVPFFAAVFSRLVLIFLRFMQPLLIRRIVELVNDPNSESAEDRGWGLTAATALVYIGLAITGGVYQHKANRMATMVRGALVNAIYAQTLELSITSLDESAAVTLMSSDVERICEALLPVHNLWSGPIEIALAVWLLQREVGLGLLGPLVVTVLAISGPFMISSRMASAQTAWMEKIQARIHTTAKTLQEMKGIKMLGLSTITSKIISQLRRDEIVKSLKMRKLMVVMIAFGNMSDLFAPAAVFLIYVIVASINGQLLDVPSAFTALSLIALLVAPIRQIVFVTPTLIAAVGCFDRIQDFLSLPTRRDHRLLLSTSPNTSRDSVGLETPRSRTASEDVVETDNILQENVSSLTAPIRVTNLSLTWSEETGPVINDVSLEFQPREVTMVVGPVGSGKSSLLKGLLGEVPSSKGHVYINRAHAAFVDQNSWIRNSSIRDNIIGMLNFEPEWYATVVHACAFDTDLETLPRGDCTIAGSSGSALSGGQKLRLALARAVYSRQPILILDDVFSGLDATSEERIFSRLFGRNGLLRQRGLTTILVTHAAHRLSYADHIIALGSNGTVAEQGKFEQLTKSGGYVAGLAARHMKEKDDQPKSEAATVKAEPEKDNARDNAEADLNRPMGSWAIYRYYFESVGWRNLSVWIVLMICYSLLMRFPDLWIKFWTGAIARDGNSVNGLYLGLLIAAAFVAMGTLILLSYVLFVKMIPRSAAWFHTKLIDTVENAPLSFFTSTDSGQVVNRFSQDLSVIDMELPLSGLILANNVCMAVIQAVFICISASHFAIVLPFVLAAVYMLQKFYLRTSRQIRLMDLEAKAPLYTNFLETLSGLVTIRAFGWNKDMQKRNMELLDASQRPFYLLYCIQRWLALVVDLMVAALAVILVALIAKFRQSADAGFVGVALINIMTFNMTVSVVVQTWTAIETSLGAISRIKSFVSDTHSENLPRESRQPPEEWPSQGTVEVSNLTASYSHDLEPALQNINLTISSGQKLGICGPSGSGKSSFVNTLLHMLEIKSGSIKIDGIDISTIPRPALRERLSVIPQDPVFLKGTIRQNLDPLSLISSAETPKIESVLENVGILSIINDAGGLSTAMDPDALLSQGQKQLFCLARAMLKPTKILILDEVSASVDVETEKVMLRIIEEWFDDVTIVAVAHRLGSIRTYDQVAVFENGRIVEAGEPEELLRMVGGKFSALWES